jgi:hypothetical protein
MSPQFAYRNSLKLVARVVTVLTIAFWWGGLTFYGMVVVPIGGEVLGGETEQGFITQRVSNIINLAGVATLIVLQANMLPNWPARGRKLNIGLTTTWLLMAVCQAILFVIHPRLDAMLDAQNRSVTNPAVFHPLHEFYLTIVGLQWTSAIVHIALLMAVWRLPE